jgi:hypothetical protein
MILSDSDYENNVYVHRADAEMRADCVSSVTYDVTLCLPKGTLLRQRCDKLYR